MNSIQKILLLFVAIFFSWKTFAHPMPHSVLEFDIRNNGIKAELQLPLKEFQLVFPNEDLENGWKTLIQRKEKWLDAYLLQHIFLTDSSGKQKWNISIQHKFVTENEQMLTGKYHELVYNLWLQPPNNTSTRNFVLHYDVIMHQLVTHKLFVKIKRDWEGGLATRDSTDADLGMLTVNPVDNSVPPVVINLYEGSKWIGFKSMLHLGIRHISEGTDHLLFLLVLLLPATLLAEEKRWAGFGGTKYSLIHLVKIVTAFTIGHSISLLFGAMKWIILPQQPVEIAIALTISISAIHAIRPLFYKKETFIAIGFGLIHGLAFATVLDELQIDATRMALSILGFNIGIELMQLFVVLCTAPWFILLSKYPLYKWVRNICAIIAIIASLGWLVERVTEHSNFISNAVEQIAGEAKWLVAALALFTMIIMQKKWFE